MRLFYFILLTIILLWSSCTQSNRVYFTIDPKDRKIVLPININDSVVSRLVFDTGSKFGTFVLDSAFCVLHSGIINGVLPDMILHNGSGWAEYTVPVSYYMKEFTVDFGNKKMEYNKIDVFNWQRYYFTSQSDGMFNIPENDTTHVWELNFEHNYVEVHLSTDFDMPNDCFVTPIIRDKKHPYPLNIRLPIEFKFPNGETVVFEQIYMIDTAMPWDLVLADDAKELDFFCKQKDVKWQSYLSRYYRYITMDVTLFDKLNVDSLRIHTFDHLNGNRFNYMVGLNFLKRFNVYFDMENNKVGLQPIKCFQRVINPFGRHFHFSYDITPQGRWLVTCVGNYAANRFKIAGLKEGDEIFRINNCLPREITSREHRKLEVESDSIVYDIFRGKDIKRIVVTIDKNEKQGD